MIWIYICFCDPLRFPIISTTACEQLVCVYMLTTWWCNPSQRGHQIHCPTCSWCNHPQDSCLSSLAGRSQGRPHIFWQISQIIFKHLISRPDFERTGNEVFIFTNTKKRCLHKAALLKKRLCCRIWTKSSYCEFSLAIYNLIKLFSRV